MSDTILMKVGDGSKISGESKIQGFTDQIELLSYSHSVAMPMTHDVSNTKRTAGTAMVGEIAITKYLDKSTPVFNQHCCMGTDLGTVIITLVQNDGAAVIPLMTYTLSNVLVSSISVGGGGGGIPTESISLNFSKIQWDYHQQKTEGSEGGKVPAVWDLTLNAAK